MNINDLLRDNIKSLKPYSSARDEFSGQAMVYLDANENPYNQPYNRYPDPLQTEVKEKISGIKKVAKEKIFLGNGSDEPIDLLFRLFCEPGKDSIVTINPTYGMYMVAADINNIGVTSVPLNEDFELVSKDILKAVTKNTKLIFLCSPNNPTGNCLDKNEMLKVVNNFDGLVVIDEAYIDFVPQKSLLPELDKYPNLVILQTFSKAWGMAGIRLGMAFASTEIVSLLNKIKYPYNINILTQQKAVELLTMEDKKQEWVERINNERERLAKKLASFEFVEKVYPSDANFLLIKMFDANGIFNYLMEKEIIVRDRSKVYLCEGSLRISIGTEEENNMLVQALEELV